MRIKKAFKITASLLAVIVILLIAITPAAAADFRGGNSVSLPQDQTVNDDLYVAAGTITISGRINGDLFASGGQVDVNGTTSQSIFAAAGTVNVRGSSGDDIRIAGGDLSVSGSAVHDLLAAGGNLNFAQNARTGGDLILATGSTVISGNIGRNVMGSGGTVSINGVVEGNVDIEVDTLRIGPNAVINGDLTYRSARDADIDPSATVAGKVTRLEPAGAAERDPARGVVSLIIDRLRFLVAPIILGLILLFAAPRTLDHTSATIGRKPWASLGWGLLLLIVTPIIGIILFIGGLILGGITISLALLAIYSLVLIIAIVFVATFLGQIMLSSVERSRWWLLWALLAGVVVLAVVTALPYIGPWLTILVLIFGAGAIMTVALEAYGRARASGTV